MHILLTDIFVVIKIFHRTKCPADRKLCRTKLNFDFFNRTFVRCPALFQGLDHGGGIRPGILNSQEINNRELKIYNARLRRERGYLSLFSECEPSQSG